MPDEIKIAKVVQILDRYEVPELILLQAPNLEFILAVRSGDLDAPENLYVGGSMTLSRLRDYANGKCDLRFAIAHANLRRFWKFTFDLHSTDVRLIKIRRSDDELVSSIPQQGLFSRDHDDIIVIKDKIPSTVHQLNIDGSWDLGEFSQLYSQIEDIYYISSDIERFDDPSIAEEERKVISGAFDRSWDGGGSYVAFYKRVANDNDYHAPLRVRGIEYNSPGFVKIYAKTEYFDGLINILQHYANNEADAKKAYNRLGAFMSGSKMKSKGFRNTHMSEAQRSILEMRAEVLAEFIPGITFGTLKSMTNGNSLVAAKVLESIFRRIQRLYRYFDEGRVEYDGLTVK